MATAKKAASKAASKKSTAPVKAPAKAAKPVAKASAKKAPVKAPMSKTAKAVERLTANIAKLTERKDKINDNIQSLRDQRTALKATPVAPAPVAQKAKATHKAAATKKAVKTAAKK
jgi:uncharacterized coiled-coil DUF342 family protein